MTEETYNKISEFIDDDNYTESEKESMWEAIRHYRTEVWHEPSEKPRPKTHLMLRMGLGIGLLVYSGHEKITWQWAYIDDLLPPKRE